MIHPQPKYHWWYPITKKLISKRPVIWLMSRTLHHLDAYVFRTSSGKYTVGSVLTGLPIVTLTTTGARSGKLRSVPLVGFPDGENYLFIASNWGQAAHPSWYYNLRSNPKATISFQGIDRQVIAHEALGSDREMFWAKVVDAHPGYLAYEKRAQGRSIPIMVCVPSKKQPWTE